MIKRLLLMACMILLSCSAFAKEAFYVPINEVHPGQWRYSHTNLQEKIESMLHSGAATWDEKHKTYMFSYDEGRSGSPLRKAYPVVRAEFGLVLVDGHHHALAGVWMGAQTLPVYLLEDMSHLSAKDFWHEAEKRGLAFLQDLDGKHKVPPKDFWELKDDPNRELARISARKYEREGGESKGAEYPLWIKVGRDVPFAEFRIADALWKAGIVYNEEDGEPSIEFVEEARKALLEADLEDLRIVPTRTHYSELDSEKTLHKHHLHPA